MIWTQSCVANASNHNVTFSLNTGIYQLQVCIRGWAPSHARSLSKQLLSLSPPSHTAHLSSFADCLPHSQPTVHDGAQVKKYVDVGTYRDRSVGICELKSAVAQIYSWKGLSFNLGTDIEWSGSHWLKVFSSFQMCFLWREIIRYRTSVLTNEDIR